MRYKERKKTIQLELNPEPSKPEVSPEFRRRPSTPEKEKGINDEEVEIIKAPFEKPKAPSLTYFRVIFRDKMGILRSQYHQNDKNFTKYPGKQSLANAIAAIAMLRQYKSRIWISKIVDDILIAGEIYYMDCKKHMSEPGELSIKDLRDKIQIGHKVYKPKVDEAGIVGRLNSLTFQLLDLPEALEEFFATHDTGWFLLFLGQTIPA